MFVRGCAELLAEAELEVRWLGAGQL